MEVSNDVSAAPRGRVLRLLIPSKKWIGAIAALTVVFGAIILSFTLRALSQSTSSDEGFNPIELPGGGGATQPIVSIAGRQRSRFVAFRKALAGVSESSGFVHPYSPQRRALEWLAYHDKTIDDPTDPRVQWKVVQRYALMVLSFSGNGEAWLGLDPWENHVTVDECSSHFEGVECDQSSGRVVSIYLADRLVTGRIPQEIALLTDLRMLDLSANRLQGHIPHVCYTHLTNLSFLKVNDNDIAFTLHEDIGNLDALDLLDVSNTYISGTLPNAMAKLTNLKQLIVSNTRLEGSFLHFLSSWRGLVSLEAAKVQAFTGTVPSEIGYLSDLRQLIITGTQLNGSIPTEIGLLTNVGYMFLGGEFQGFLPTEIGNLSDLHALVLNPLPGIRGSLPSILGTLPRLRFINIENSGIGGRIPSELAMLKGLQTLNLPNNLFSGPIPSQLGTLKQLEVLQINANNLYGTIPKGICDLDTMVHMDCNGKLVCELDCCPVEWCEW